MYSRYIFNFAHAAGKRVTLENVEIWEILMCVEVHINLVPWRQCEVG